MFIHRRFAATAAIFALATAAAAMQAGAPTTVPDTRELEALVQKLGDANFAVRTEAQAQLDKIPLSQRDALAAIAEKTKDEEIKARLTDQLGFMDDRLAIDLPPISIDLQNASFRDAVAALAKATGATLGTSILGEGTYTLKATDQPFWQVIEQLSRQHPIGMTTDPVSPARACISGESMPHMQITRGIAVMADDAKMQNGKVMLNLAAGLDPRIAVLDFHPMTIDDLQDNLGHKLAVEPEPPVRRRPNATPPSFFQFKAVTCALPEALGTTVTVKGSVSLLVQLAQSSVEIADASKHLNEAIPMGDSTVTVRDFLRNNPGGDDNVAGIFLQISPKDAATKPPEPPKIQMTANGISLNGIFSASDKSRLVIDNEGSGGGMFMGVPNTGSGDATRVHVVDAKGKVVADYKLPRQAPITSVHIVDSHYQEPLKFTLSFPTKTREVKIPFEFKDLPIQFP